MTRTTVYHGTPDDYDDDEPLADLFHDHESDADAAVVVETPNGEFRVPDEDWCDIYIDGTPVGEE